MADRPPQDGLVDWEAKLRAFLHDPPHKAVCLAQRVGHEGEARTLSEVLGVGGARFDPSADHLASAADRPRGLESVSVDWLAEPAICRPTGGRVTWADAELRATVGGLDARALTEEIVQCLNGLAPLPARERFLAVWRLLPDLLPRMGEGRPLSEGIGPWWHVLPADTRVPDHSIWSHARMVSAFQGALPEPALLEVRLGPVQAFIRSARRTRDLWAGSWLLSYLAAAAAWEVALAVGPDAVVFPDLFRQPLVDLWIRRELGAGSGALEGPLRELRDTLPPDASFPNRLVALVPVSLVEEVGARAARAVRRRMVALTESAEKVARRAAGSAGADASGDGWTEHWRRVAEDFPETVWAAVGLPADAGERGFEELLSRAEGWAGASALATQLRNAAQAGRYTPNPGLGYPAAYRLLQAALDARRTLRGFAQWEGEGERCTVCGDRPALPLADPGAGRDEQRDVWRRFAHDLRGHAGSVWVALDGREMLCGLCLVRRGLPEVVPQVEEASWSGDKPRFPSTSTVATACWRERVEGRAATDTGIAEALDQLEDVAGRTDAAGELPLYASRRKFARLDGRVLLRLDVRHLEEDYGDGAGDLAAAGELLREAARDALGAPPTYYAVLAMDGDRMGRWLSGDPGTVVRSGDVVHPQALGGSLDAAAPAPLGPSRHAGLSAVIRDFSLLGVPGIVRQGRGALVYAGGDDVLALVPVETVFETALRLRVGFTEGGAGDGRDAWVPGDPDRPDRPPPGLGYWIGTGRVTASAGIAIAHHLTDLRTVVEAALEMEGRAKSDGGRDAVGVAVLKRSGERREAVWPWFVGDAAGLLVSSPAVVTAWRDAFARPGGVSPGILSDLEAEEAVGTLAEEAIRGRLRYLLERHGAVGPELDRLAEGLLAVRRSLMGRGWTAERAWGPAGCLGLVAVAAFVARGGRE